MLLIGNGRVITRDQENPYLEDGAVVISGEKIKEVGSLTEMKAKYPEAEFVDAKGGVIMPGLINAHTHIYSGLARGLSIAGNNPTNFLPENADDFPFDEYDYVVDAVDTVTAKIEIIMQAQKYGTQVISSMGAGNKLDPAAFQVADIYKTKMCPLAKVMRRELKKRGVKKLKVVYSEEKPTRPIEDMSISCRTNCICPPGAEHKCTERRDIPGSVAFVPSVAGLIIAGEVVKDIAGK